MTVLYPNAPDLKFDFEYYKNHHLPLIMKLYGRSIDRFELRKGLTGQDGTTPPGYAAVVNIWIADEAAFAANNVKHGPTLVADVPNFSNKMPTAQQDEVYAFVTS